MNIMRHIAFLILSVWLTVNVYAIPLCHIQRYDENDGVTQWHLTQMTQDRQGMMWFSTWNGLCRYDGYEFRGFKGRVGDGSGLATDRFRNVWLTDGGQIGCRVDDDMYLFNLKTYRFEAGKNMKPNHHHAKAVKENRPYEYHDSEGNVWIVCYDGTLWVKSPGGKAQVYDGGRMESARFCMPDVQGNLWVLSTSAIYKLSFPKRNGTFMRSSLPSEAKAFFLDRYHRYWIATKGDNRVTIYDKDNQLVGWLAPNGNVTKTPVGFTSPIYCIYQSHDGTIWLGSKPGGLFRLKEIAVGKKFYIDRIQLQGCNDVYDIKEDQWGRLWLATLGGGICCVQNPKAASPRILYPGNGLLNFPKEIGHKARMIHITKDNIMLVATTDALVVSKLLPKGSEGKMLFRCHQRESHRKDALSCSATMNVAEDSRGRIFVSTESGGVNMVTSRQLTASKLSFRHFGKDNGLSTDVALSVVPFNHQMLVVSSSSIVVFNSDNGWQASFNRRFFLSDCRFSEAIPICLEDGRWLFGMQDGIFAIAANKLRKSNFVPNIALTNINVQGRDKDWPINAADTISLASDERSLTLSFAALDYSSAAEISYAFMLQNMHDDKPHTWNQIGQNHSVTLLDLAPGEYRLLIRSTNADGTWVHNDRMLTILVTPTFWETTWAKILLVLLVFLFLMGGVYTLLYIRRIKRQRREALEAYLNLLNADGEDKWKEKPVRPELSEENDALMRKVSAFVEEHLSDADVGVGDMADAAAVSRSGLQRKMKQIMGVTPLDFLKEARMKHACHLLSTTTMNVSDVAYACGYTDPKYFSRSFKASVGKSPKEWRDAL